MGVYVEFRCPRSGIRDGGVNRYGPSPEADEIV